MTTSNLQHGERIDDLPLRFDILRNRAQRAGQLAAGHEGLSYLLPRAAGLCDDELVAVLQQFNMS